MLEKTSDNADHTNAVTHTAKSRQQTADTAHDQIDLDTGLRGAVQRRDDLGIDQRIHLGDDAPTASGLGVR